MISDPAPPFAGCGLYGNHAPKLAWGLIPGIIDFKLGTGLEGEITLFWYRRRVYGEIAKPELVSIWRNY